MKKVFALVLVLVALATIGFGQEEFSVGETRMMNDLPKMNWVKMTTVQRDGIEVFMNTSKMYKTSDGVAVYTIKLVKNSVALYTTILVSCLTEDYINSLTFVQSVGSTKYHRSKDADEHEPQKLDKKQDPTFYNMAMVACRDAPISDR